MKGHIKYLVFLVFINFSLTSTSAEKDNSIARKTVERSGLEPEITFLGNTSLYFRDTETAIMIDGYFSRHSFRNTVFGKVSHRSDLFDDFLEVADISSLDAIIPLHSHFDHLLDASYYLKKFDTAKLIGSKTSVIIARDVLALSSDLESDQLEEMDLKLNDIFNYKVGKFEITIEKAIHGKNGIMSCWAPIRSFTNTNDKKVNFADHLPIKEYVEGGSFNIAIKHKESRKTYYILGGQVPENLYDQTLLTEADVIFAAVKITGAEKTSFYKWFWRQLESKQDVLLIPIHWDNFFKPIELGCKIEERACLKKNVFLNTSIAAFKEKVGNSVNLRLKCLDAFDRLYIGKSSCSSLL